MSGNDDGASDVWPLQLLRLDLIPCQTSDSSKLSTRYSCPVAGCHKAFPVRKSLNRHIETIHGPTSLPCRFLCGLQFNRRDNRNRHEAETHQGTAKMVTCAVCCKEVLARALDVHFKSKAHFRAEENKRKCSSVNTSSLSAVWPPSERLVDPTTVMTQLRGYMLAYLLCKEVPDLRLLGATNRATQYLIYIELLRLRSLSMQVVSSELSRDIAAMPFHTILLISMLAWVGTQLDDREAALVHGQALSRIASATIFPPPRRLTSLTREDLTLGPILVDFTSHKGLQITWSRSRLADQVSKNEISPRHALWYDYVKGLSSRALYQCSEESPEPDESPCHVSYGECDVRTVKSLPECSAFAPAFNELAIFDSLLLNFRPQSFASMRHGRKLQAVPKWRTVVIDVDSRLRYRDIWPTYTPYAIPT